jgi:1-acyl-sn-glycerol-3-phosphate acyltransferase
MLRAIFFFLGLALHQLMLYPRLRRSEALTRAGRVREGRVDALRVSQEWSRRLLWLAGCRVTVHGRSELAPGQAALVVSNHQGFFDIPLLGAHLGMPVAFVAKVELSKIPLVSRWMKQSGCVFLARNDRRQALEVVKEAVANLQGGLSMVIFPEGTRSYSPQMGEFRKGSTSIAAKAGVPVLPVTVNHTWKAFNNRQKGIRPADIELHIHPLVYPERLTPEQQANLSDHLKTIIAGPLPPQAANPPASSG